MAVFGDLEDQLLEVFSTGREPDYAAARRLLDSGADINAVPLEEDEEERGRNLLSDFFLNQWEAANYNDTWELVARHMPDVVRFFLSSGFNVHKQDDAFGAYCLQELIFAVREPQVLEVAKLLLQAGARNIRLYDETPLDTINHEADYLYVDCRREDSLLLYALTRIVEAADEGKPYLGIDFYAHCKGRRVGRVLMEGETPEFYDLTTPNGPLRNCFQRHLYMQCEDLWLVFDRYADIWSDRGDIRAISGDVVDVSDRFAGIVGRKISDFYVGKKDGMPLTRIILDDGTSHDFCSYYNELTKESFCFCR
jgi:hypothetical protein